MARRTKRAAELEPGDILIKRRGLQPEGLVITPHRVDLVQHFRDPKKGAMVHVKAGARTFTFRAEDIVEAVPPEKGNPPQ